MKNLKEVITDLEVGPTSTSNQSNSEDESVFSKHSNIWYWGEFEKCLKDRPLSQHGKIILPWNRNLECYDNKEVMYYKPPNIRMSQINKPLRILRKLPLYNPYHIN